MLIRSIDNNFRKAICLIIMSLVLVGCQDTIPNRSIIDDAAQAGSTTGSTSGGATGVSRPDNAVKFKTDFCGCKDGVAITYGNCASTCASKGSTSGAGILYVNFNVTEDISLNTTLKNLDGWCNTVIPNDVVTTNPRCALKAADENNNGYTLDVVKGSVANSLTINIDALAEDKAYVLTLTETSSLAKSDSIQIIKYSADVNLSTLGPLKVAPISQYSCISRPVSTDTATGDIYYDAAFRTHYYFLPRIPPNPIAAGSDIVCHDWLNPLYGAIDDALFPRLELLPGIFNLWDTTDPRFYDNNGNTYLDVNDIIIQKAKNFGATTIPVATNFFTKFPVMTTEEATTDAGGTVSAAQSMGYYMAPWIDQTTFRSYCLNSTHYASSNPLFKAMRDVVGVDMEGIYVGVKAAESVIDRDGNVVTAPSDFLLIRETDLKQVWFWMNNNVPTAPTDANVSTKAVYFYYPLNLSSPYIRSSTQKLYQLKGALELSNGVSDSGSTSTGSGTTFPPHDKKIGCVPKF